MSGKGLLFGCRLATKLVEEDGRRPSSQYGGYKAPIKLFTDTTKAFFPSLGNYFPFRAMGLAGLGLFILPASSRVGLKVPLLGGRIGHGRRSGQG